MRGVVVAVVLALLLSLIAWLGLSAAPAATARAASTRPPVVLMLHSGGFVMGSTESLRRSAARVRMLGAKPVLIDYPLGDPQAAFRYVRRIARSYPRRRTVYAYGESAGGTLAVRLAQGRKLVDRAAAYSPTAHITELLAGSEYGNPFEDATNMNLDQRQVRRPTLALALHKDALLDGRYRRQIVRWARHDHGVKLWRRPGPHLGGPQYRRNMRDALDWLLRGKNRCGNR